MNRVAIVTSTLLFLLLGGGGGAYFYWTTTPSYALSQAVDAIQDGDRARFESYVDLEGVVNSLVEEAMRARLKSSAVGDEPFGALGETVGMQVMQVFEPQVKREIREKVLGLFSGSGDGKLTFTGLGETKYENGFAIIPVHLKNSASNQEVKFEVKMKRVDSHWKVIELQKVEPLVKALQ